MGKYKHRKLPEHLNKEDVLWLKVTRALCWVGREKPYIQTEHLHVGAVTWVLDPYRYRKHIGNSAESLHIEDNYYSANFAGDCFVEAFTESILIDKIKKMTL